MPRDAIDMETMELYKRTPVNEYKDSGYHQMFRNSSHGEFCSMCGQNDYEDVTRNIAVHKRKTRSYERHCPSCHCPPERRKFSPLDRPRTPENVEAMLNRYERVPAKAINSAIKKSQSSPLSPKAYWHDCQTNIHPRCPKRLLPAHRHRKMKRDVMNLELTNEDVETCSKYTQRVPVKSSLKKGNHCREPEVSPDEQQYSDAESDVSMKYTQHVQQPRKSNFGSRRHCISGDGEYIVKNESDIDGQNEHECQEMRKLILRFQDLEKLKHGETTVDGENHEKTERREIDAMRAVKSRKLNNVPCYITDKPSMSIKESINKSPKDTVFNCPAQLTKLKLHATKNHILESIDHALGAMDDTKKTITQPEQTEQDTIDKISREIQENGWQVLLNALTIHRDSTDITKRTVRLECLNHMRQELDKLYALESTLENCALRQSLSDHNVSRADEHQQSQQQEQKVTET